MYGLIQADGGVPSALRRVLRATVSSLLQMGPALPTTGPGRPQGEIAESARELPIVRAQRACSSDLRFGAHRRGAREWGRLEQHTRSWGLFRSHDRVQTAMDTARRRVGVCGARGRLATAVLCGFVATAWHCGGGPQSGDAPGGTGGAGNAGSTPHCGDGVVVPPEECDEGDQNWDPTSPNAYGHCTTECKLGPRCGDGAKSGDEECDEGKDNVGQYGDADACTPDCRKTHWCGDGIVDVDHGEKCDDGDRNGTVDGWCFPGCRNHGPVP